MTRGVSLRPVEDRALAALAVEDGHLNRSRVVQRLIQAEMRRRFGKNWERQYEAEGAA